MQRTLLALALIVTAGASYAQTMPGNEARDPYGRPLVGRNDWVRQPGDQPGNQAGNPNMNYSGNPNAAYSGNANMATAPANTNYSGNSNMMPRSSAKLSTEHATGPEPMPAQAGPRQAAFKDEYGFRYDSEGNRLDARGNIMSPHIPSR
jgi:hypothetical protein